MPQSLFSKIWKSHVVSKLDGGDALVYTDRIIAHEITTPPAVTALREKFGGQVFDATSIVAINDHVSPARDTETALQAQFLRTWAREAGVKLFDVGSNGICHVVVAEQALVKPGTIVCCGDSHTCTLGALGALAFGVGSTAQAGAMLAQVLLLREPEVIRVSFTGKLQDGATAKDLALTVISTLGFNGATRCVLEYTGPGLSALTMEERMTLCNMSIESGATTGVCEVDETTIEYLRSHGSADGCDLFEQRAEVWRTFRADVGADYKERIEIDLAGVVPVVSWGTNPGEIVPIDGVVPADADPRSLEYMALQPGEAVSSLAVDQAFIGSCTNSRISDLRAAAAVLRGRKVSVPTIITPGSQEIRVQAEREGLHEVFYAAGALWTHSSCGPCIGMSMGVLAPGMRCISSSNRNFPGRMGQGGRVHLASPAVVATSAVLGRIASPSSLPELVSPGMAGA